MTVVTVLAIKSPDRVVSIESWSQRSLNVLLGDRSGDDDHMETMINIFSRIIPTFSVINMYSPG